MESEDFRTLIEIQSLENQISTHHKNIETEKNRITFIEKNRLAKEEELTQSKSLLEICKKKLTDHETELFKVDQNFEKTEKHASMVTSSEQATAIEHELKDLGETKSNLEEAMLELIDEQETIEATINECEIFLAGSLTSLEEIKVEVQDIVAKEQGLILGLEKRVESLLEEVPSTLRTLFLQANTNYRFKNPIAFIAKGFCNQCHYEANVQKEKGVNLMTSVETCEGCGRLFAPEAAKSANLRA